MYFSVSGSHDDYVYTLFVTIWCYGIMIFVGICCLINLGIQQYKEYKAQMKKYGNNFSEVFIPGGLWTEWINVKLVAWLVFLYLVLQLPYVIIQRSTALKSQSDNSSNAPDTSLKYETVLTWFRYLYSCIFACLVFKIRKDIRYKFRALLNCCRPNVVRDHSAVPVVKHDNKKKENRKDSRKGSIPISFSTPVLYISPEGLCLRQLAPPTKSFLNYSKNDKVNDKLNEAPNFISYLCDVEFTSAPEEYSSNLDESFSNISRRSSKESEVSLSELGTKDSKNESQDIPLKDMDSRVFEKPKSVETILDSPTFVEPPVPKKKTVRFAETLTFYRPLTPRDETPPPQWITTGSRPKEVQTGIRSRYSKIPMRIQPTVPTSPWRIDISDKTYRVSSPAHRTINRTYIVNKKTGFSSKKSKDKNHAHWMMGE